MKGGVKGEIVFIFHAALGGVPSFYYNIINYSTLKDNFITKVILLKSKEDNREIFKEKFNVDESILFNYSEKENQYYVLKRLDKIIGRRPGAIICDNAKALISQSVFNNPKTVFHLLHDYFYVNQHIAYSNAIDVAVAHSSFFSDCVFAANPRDFSSYSFYIPYGVKQYDKMPEKKTNQKLKLFFLGRLEESKGVNLLSDIEEQLVKKNIAVNWTIIGKGSLKEWVVKLWQGKNNVQFASPDTTKDVYELLSNQDIFIFPTEFEGTPVSIMEAMSNGCVTLVNNLPGGIRDMITDDVGYKLPMNDTGAFVKIITELNHDREKLVAMQTNAWQKAKRIYDVNVNADNYFKLFAQFKMLKRHSKKKSVVKLSRLDKPYFPNLLVKLLRSL